MMERDTTIQPEGTPDPPHEIRTQPPRFRGGPGDGPRVGLASYELRDPEATFRLIEPFRPRPEPRPPGAGTWALRALLVWAVNLVALAGAGLLLTAVGPTDPFAYVAWGAVFG